MNLSKNILTALRQWTVICELRWQNTRLPSFDKVQFWHWHPAAHSHFPSTSCLFKCVTKVSSWYVAMFAAVDREPALPHCVTALAGPITTFKLHNTVKSYGCHGGIVCFNLHKMKNLFWIFLCSSPFHFKESIYPRESIAMSPLVAPAPDPDTRHQAAPAVSRSSHSWSQIKRY